jgi:hypothetical protein
VQDDSDDNSEDIDEGSADEDELLKKKTKKDKKEDDDATNRKDAKKSQDEIKKSLFLGEKYGHYKIGTYVQIEIQVEKKFSRMLEPEYPIVLCSLKH